MWLLVFLAGAWLVLGIRAARLGMTREMATAFAGATGLLLLAGFLGVRGARTRRQAQEARARHAARLLLVAELGKHDDTTLERIARSGGPAADAAMMILQGRHMGNPAGGPKLRTPET
jgi:hypothetical protein